MDLVEKNKTKGLSDEPDKSLSTWKIILISLTHLTIGIGIIALSTYIPAELKFLNWSESTIAYLVGIATLFELSRLVVGYYGDTRIITYKKFFALGFIVSILGLVVIAHTIDSIAVLGGMIFFTIGSAILSTIIDAYLIAKSRTENKNKIAAVTQFFRLSGFALGGVLGVVLYERLSFWLFFYVIATLHFIVSVLTFLLLQEKITSGYQELDIPKKVNLSLLLPALKDKAVIGMSLFLILYPIGLFAQDAVLEPFAIGVLQFTRSGVGRMAAIWGTATLIFIPIAIFVERKISRIFTIFVGLTLASIALVIIAYLGVMSLSTDSSIRTAQNILYGTLFLFGAGLGLMTTPGTAMMFDICAHNKMLTTSLIAYFGMLVTLSRASAAFISGIVLDLTGTNFTFLFILEAVILFSSLFPLIYVNRLFKTMGIRERTDNSLAIPDL